MEEEIFNSKQYREVILDLENPGWIYGIFKDLDIEELFNYYKYAEVNRCLVVIKDGYGFNYYNTKIAMKHPGLGNRDLLAEHIAAGKKYGIDVIPLLPVAWDICLSELHPEWIQIDINGNKCIYVEAGQNPWRNLCVNTGYRDYYYSLIKEVVEYEGIKGVYADLLFYDQQNLACYCNNCKEKYRKEVGKEMPDKIDWSDPDFIQFIKWRYQNLLDFKKGIRDIVKGYNPKLLFGCNYHGPIGSGLWYNRWLGGQTAESGVEYNDRTFCEAYADIWGYGYLTLLPKWIRGASGGKPADITTYRFFGDGGWDFALKPKEMLKYELVTYAANGASVCLVDAPYEGGKFEPKVYEYLKYAYDEIKEKEEYIYNKNPLSYLAIYYSQNSKDFYGRGEMDRYEPGFLGGFQIATDLHLPTDIIFDRDLTIDKLTNYKIIYIPNAVCMSESQIKTIKEYVNNGGNLIVTHKTSLANEDGFTRNNFGLSDLLGVNYIKESDFDIGYISIPKDSSIYDESINYPLLIRCESPLLFNTSNNVNILSYLMNPICKKTKEQFYGINVTPPNPSRMPENPLIVYNKYGKGNVVYIGANLEKDYAKFGHPFDREIIRLIVEKIFKEFPPIKIKAPLSVDTIFFKEGNKYIINLINFHTNKRTETTPSRSKLIIPIMEEILPIYDIVIETSFKVKKAYIVPENNELKITNKEGGSTLILPKLDMWSTVVIES